MKTNNEFLEFAGINNGVLEPVSPFATEFKIKSYLDLSKKGEIKMGLSTGSKNLDTYYRLKPGKLLIVNGHDNVGKSSIIWYISFISALLHGWNWIIFSSENEEGEVFSQMMEFYYGKRIEQMNESEYSTSYNFIKKHFKIINIDRTYTATEILDIAETECKISKVHGLMLDPYNSLEMDYSLIKKSENQHNYDYKIAGRLRIFAKNNNVYTVLNTHAATESLRQKYAKDTPPFMGEDISGHPMPPQKADTEGGGKFANRADDFITIHRFVQHKNIWFKTLFIVRKVKNTKTGGKPTPMDAPVVFEMNENRCGYKIEGEDVVWNFHSSKLNNNHVLKTIVSRDFTEPIKDDIPPF